jgi:DNA polymerase III epsilon subunit-like protein
MPSAAGSDSNAHSTTLAVAKAVPVETEEMMRQIEELDFPADKRRHSYYDCYNGRCRNLHYTESGKSGTFKHEWIVDKKLSYCNKTGIWWLVFIENDGMYCVLCKKHNVGNTQNKIKAFGETASVRYKRSALVDHVEHTKQHSVAIQNELISRVSAFAKAHDERVSTKDEVIFNAFLSAYWLMQEEIANKKLFSLLKLLQVSGLEIMKYFPYTSRTTVREFFILIGSVIENKIVNDVNSARCYGILADDVSDISVKELMIGFVQYVKNAEVQVRFLFVEDILQDSITPDAETITAVLKEALSVREIDLKSMSSFVSDGASVFLGCNNGVAQKLRNEVPSLINIHCICHRLALACTDTLGDLAYVKEVQDTLRQLWQFFENSNKRTAVYAQVQTRLKLALNEGEEHPALGAKVQKVVTKKLKKACSTRWLSFDSAVKALFDDYIAVSSTLRALSKEAIAVGLLHKIDNTRFLYALYVLHSVLPKLSVLSKIFQRGTVSFSLMSPAIDHLSAKLDDLLATNAAINLLEDDLSAGDPGGRLSLLAQPLTEAMKTQACNFQKKYILALKDNIRRRFDQAIPILEAASGIFNPVLIPEVGGPGFPWFGEHEILILAEHFFPDDPQKQLQLKDEFTKFKYDLVKWKKCLPDVIRNGKSSLTPMDWVLQRFMRLQPTLNYDLLSLIVEVLYSLPVSNAWPERGASCLKRLKTKHRNRMGMDMLQSLMQVSINGPKCGTQECLDVVQEAVHEWTSNKKRRKLARHRRQVPKQGRLDRDVEKEEYCRATTDVLLRLGLPLPEPGELEEEYELIVESDSENEIESDDDGYPDGFIICPTYQWT